jgi:hypothetical protein
MLRVISAFCIDQIGALLAAKGQPRGVLGVALGRLPNCSGIRFQPEATYPVKQGFISH